VPTYAEVASSYHLWGEYVDPNGIMTEHDFDLLAFEEKIELQEDIWGAALDEEEE
jgi:hypothetical protein